MSPVTRGTSNRNERGSAEARRRRREWLLETYAADVSPVVDFAEDGSEVEYKVCRCYRCGNLLGVNTLTVDRIIPGCQGGTYRRDNIRPACARCNEKTGGALANHPRNRKKKKS